MSLSIMTCPNISITILLEFRNRDRKAAKIMDVEVIVWLTDFRCDGNQAKSGVHPVQI